MEDLFLGDTASTAAHELSHTMGVHHDDTLDKSGKFGECPLSKLYVMTPIDGYPKSAVDAKNPWTFSPCSIAVMKMTHSNLTKTADGQTCLEKHSYNEAEYNRILNSLRLGAIYSKDEQCEMAIRTGVKYCDNYARTKISEKEICWKGLPCDIEVSEYPCYRFQVIHPNEGTSCGESKQVQ